MRIHPTRRLVLRLLAGASVLMPGSARPQDGPRDQGIGGTGMMRTDPPRDGGPGEGDRGIGGTGVIGTIRGFGSILVNGLRIAYPADAAVFLDGEPAKAADLKVGHVVSIVARPEGAGLTTWRIDVASEVVGPVESAVPDRLVVLGQRVSTAGLPGGWKAGDRVAVSGLRRPDGVIVASLIEPRAGGPERVAGPVRRGADGAPTIGDLRLTGTSVPLVGRRALVTGAASAGALQVTNAANTAFPPGLRSASIEAYVGRAGAGLELGSGLVVAGRASSSVPGQGSVRAVLTAAVARDGSLTVERLKVEDRVAPRDRRGGRGDDAPRFERERDRIDLRGLPGERPGASGGAPGGQSGVSPSGSDPRGTVIDTRPSPGGIPSEGSIGGGQDGGFGGGPIGPGGVGPTFNGPGGPGPGFGGPGGPGGAGGGPGGPGGGFGGPGRGR